MTSSVPRSSPIQINGRHVHHRPRRDTIDAIKDPSTTSSPQGGDVVAGLGASTPPSFVPDGNAHKEITRVDKYEILEQVGGYNSGNVYKARNIHNEKEFICKVYTRAEYCKAASVYYRISDHPNINQIADHVILQTKVYAFYFPGQPMQPTKESAKEKGCSNGEGFKADNLHNLIRSKMRLREDEAARLFSQIVKAVAHCHRHNIVAKDLKLRKFIFRDVERKEVLLECADDAHVLEEGTDDKISEDGKAFPAYVSPEMIIYLKSDKSKDLEFNGKSRDIWRLGVMLYTMIVGNYPFKRDDPQVWNKICQCHYQIPQHVSNEAKDLIRRLLRKHPKHRISANDVQYHPWITNHHINHGATSNTISMTSQHHRMTSSPPQQVPQIDFMTSSPPLYHNDVIDGDNQVVP